MKKIYLLQALIAITLLVAGCDLSVAPECAPGAKRCENNSVINSALYYTCTDDYEWKVIASCKECQDNECVGRESDVPCEVEGETECYDKHQLSIEFMCISNQWVPTICPNNSYCEGNVCGEHGGSCQDGAKQCIWVEELDFAIEAICIDNSWVPIYCPKGYGCDGDRCEAVPDIPEPPIVQCN